MINKITRRIKQIASYHTGKYLICPDFLSLLITYRCNFRCQSCNIWNNHEYPDMDYAAWENIADEIINFFPPHTHIEINGGEPLLRKDLVYHLTKKFVSSGFVVSLNTNGSLLDSSTLKKLERSGLDFIKLSLYSLDDSIHDKLRGWSGASRLAFQALEMLKGSKIKTEIGILITRLNISSIKPLLGHISKNFPFASIILQPLDEIIESPESKMILANTYPENLWPEAGETQNFFSWLKSAKNPQIKNSRSSIEAIRRYYINPSSAIKRRCLSGQHSLIIYPDGNLSFCFKRKNIGNISSRSLPEILINDSVNARNEIRYCQKQCRIVGCNFSRNLGEIVTDMIYEPKKNNLISRLYRLKK